MARALAAAIVVSLLAVSGAGGAGAQTPKRGGTLVLNVAAPFGAEPACLAAAVSRCHGGPPRALMDYVPSAVVPGAFEIAPDLTWRPRLVSTVDVGKTLPFTLVYHIRTEARWSDGVPLTARDFVFTFRTLTGIDELLTDVDRSLLDQMRSVRALDPKTVRVVLRSRFAGWRSLFAIVLPRHALEGEDYPSVWTDMVHNPKTGGPIGSGPFLVERFERGKQLTLVRNPRYWGQHAAYLDRLVFRFDSGSDLGKAFNSGQIDYHWGFPPNRDFVSDLREIPGARVRSRATPFWEHIAIRVGQGGHPALRNKLVRRALAYGIDREAIVRDHFDEIAPGLSAADSTLFIKTSPYYRPNWSTYSYRPAEARRLLEQAGCRIGAAGIYSCAGELLSLRLLTREANTVRAHTLALVQPQLRLAGIEVVPVFAPGDALFNQILPSGDFDLALFAWNLGPEVLPRNIHGCGGALNFTGYCQRLVTRDLDQAERVLDHAQRARVLNRADAQMAKDVPVIPLFWGPIISVVRTTMHGFVLHPNHPFWGAEDWWLER